MPDNIDFNRIFRDMLQVCRLKSLVALKNSRSICFIFFQLSTWKFFSGCWKFLSTPVFFKFAHRKISRSNCCRDSTQIPSFGQTHCPTGIRKGRQSDQNKMARIVISPLFRYIVATRTVRWFYQRLLPQNGRVPVVLRRCEINKAILMPRAALQIKQRVTI